MSPLPTACRPPPPPACSLWLPSPRGIASWGLGVPGAGALSWHRASLRRRRSPREDSSRPLRPGPQPSAASVLTARSRSGPGLLPTQLPREAGGGVQATEPKPRVLPGTQAASIQDTVQGGHPGWLWVHPQPPLGPSVPPSPAVPKLVACGCSCPPSPTRGHRRRGGCWFQGVGGGVGVLAPFMGVRGARSGGQRRRIPGRGFLSVPVPGAPSLPPGEGCTRPDAVCLPQVTATL